MKGITRIVNSLSRLGGCEIISRGSTTVYCSSSYSSLLASRRSLFISVATHFLTNSHDSWTIVSPLTSSTSSSLSQKWAFHGGQIRTMFIQTQSMPNPYSLMFYPGKPVMEVGSADFPNIRSALGSPSAKAIYSIDG